MTADTAVMNAPAATDWWATTTRDMDGTMQKLDTSTPDEGSEDLMRAALRYLEKGFAPVPLKGNSKVSRMPWKIYQDHPPTEAQVRQWWTDHPGDNIGLVTGAAYGFVAIDVDGPVGAKSLTALGDMEGAAVARTGADGWHYLFAHPGGAVKTCAAAAPGIDIRADGGYIVVEPSIHPETGQMYSWVTTNNPLTSSRFAPVPGRVRALLSGDTGDRSAIPEGQRNTTLTKEAGKLIRNGCSEQETCERLREMNRDRCRPPLPDAEVSGIVQSIAGKEARKPVGVAKRTVQKATPAFQRLSDVVPTTVEWLWPNYIPLGKITLVIGDPGVGKSTLTTDLAARVSSGAAMPDGHQSNPAGVVMLSAEDGASDTVAPRLAAAGGDPTQILLIPHLTEANGTERLLRLPDDALQLKAAVEACGARLVIIDPISAYLAAEINSFRDQDARRALAPLAALADQTGAAIVLVAHLNKQIGTSAMYRAGGSIGFVAASRAAFLIAADPADENQRIFAPVKFNLGAAPSSRCFTIVGAPNGSSRAVWGGTTGLVAGDLLGSDAPPTGKREAAATFLRNVLADGPQLVVEVEALATRNGISESTLNRARADLGIETTRIGFGGSVMMHLPLDPSVTPNAVPLTTLSSHGQLLGERANDSSLSVNGSEDAV